LVPETVAASTGKALRGFSGPDGRHEGLVLWLGRRSGDDTLILAAVVPEADHGRGFVRIHHGTVGSTSRAARRVGLSALAQVHSHPGSDTRHSDGDDRMVLLPYEGMFSLVVGRYGDEPVDPQGGVGLHQYQDGHWVQVLPMEEAFVLIPAVLA